ncbi:MAG: TlyA family RNA methyltransferase [Fusobacteria bacterium]|nr:TlyA family RNA methyltransferase [Fusobacteriota bacterium]
MSKTRLDVYLVENGYFETRQRARAEIMAGNILVDNCKIEKAGALIKDTAIVKIIKKSFPYVSRGALKLLKALDEFDIKVDNKICLDIGASTGGFTEILLLRGAKKVYSIDVGHNQLAFKLRNDPRVISKEKVNARYLTSDILDNILMDIIVTDVSFISLDKILQPAFDVLKDKGIMIALIKPQFEAGKDAVIQKGIVKDKNVHQEVIRNIVDFAVKVGFSPMALEKSPISGTKGNDEYLILFIKEQVKQNRIDEDSIYSIVNNTDEKKE